MNLGEKKEREEGGSQQRGIHTSSSTSLSFLTPPQGEERGLGEALY